MGRISTHACRDKKSCIGSAIATRPHLGKLECPTALSGDGDLLKSGQRVHSKWHGMKVVGRQAEMAESPFPSLSRQRSLQLVKWSGRSLHPFSSIWQIFVKRKNGKVTPWKNIASSSCLQIVTPRLSTVNTESRNTCNLGSTDCFQQVIVTSSWQYTRKVWHRQ